METTFRQKIILIAFGIFAGVVLLEAALRLAGAGFTMAQEWRNARSKGEITILCLGESTTALGGEFSYPSQLERILNASGKGPRFRVVNKGAVGMDSTYLLSNLPYCLDAYAPQVLVTMIGVNDPGTLVYVGNSPRRKAGQAVRSLRVYKLVRSIYWHFLARYRGAMTAAPAARKDVDGLEKGLLRAVQNNPGNTSAYISLAWLNLIERGSWIKAQPYLRKAAGLDPAQVFTCIEMGWYCKGQGKYAQAREAFREAIALNPKDTPQLAAIDDLAHVELARAYKDDGDLEKAGEILRESMRSGVLRAVAAVELAWVYEGLGDFNKAQDAYIQALELKADNAEAFIGLGWIYWHRGEYPAAERLFLRAAEVDPGKERPFLGLVAVYRSMGQEEKALAILQKLKEKEYDDQKVTHSIADIYDQAGIKGGTPPGLRHVRERYYSSTTVENYRSIRRLAQERGVLLVCVQYPLRSVEPLKLLFAGDSDGVVFVDNEAAFKAAVARKGYKAYFTDLFAGDFGHCTAEGNRLLAEGVARAILRAYPAGGPAR